jgi:hypothetical protein
VPYDTHPTTNPVIPALLRYPQTQSVDLLESVENPHWFLVDPFAKALVERHQQQNETVSNTLYRPVAF